MARRSVQEKLVSLLRKELEAGLAKMNPDADDDDDYDLQECMGLHRR